MNSTLMTTGTTPAAGLAWYAAATTCTAPSAAAHGTGLPFAGSAAAEVAVAGVRTIDLPGSPPRGAPV